MHATQQACIFAYGQTGAGKTWTMEGSPDDRGVNYRTLAEVFRLREERADSMRYTVHVRRCLRSHPTHPI